VARVGEKANTYRILMGGKLEERVYLEDLGEERKMILKQILNKWDAGHR